MFLHLRLSTLRHQLAISVQRTRTTAEEQIGNDLEPALEKSTFLSTMADSFAGAARRCF